MYTLTNDLTKAQLEHLLSWLASYGLAVTAENIQRWRDQFVLPTTL